MNDFNKRLLIVYVAYIAIATAVFGGIHLLAKPPQEDLSLCPFCNR